MISSGAARCAGGIRSGTSHGRGQSSKRRSPTAKPHSPAWGRAPRPQAASSRISPPLPVAAPGCGEMPVGWLWVSTLITSPDSPGTAPQRRSAGSTAQRGPKPASSTAALSS